MKYKVCLVCHKYHLDERFHILPVQKAFEERFDLVRHFVDDFWPSKVKDFPNYQDFDAIIWLVKFSDLISKPSFQWQDYKGLRIMYDWDAFDNFSTMKANIHIGCWPEVFKRNEFQILVVTGKATRDNMLDNGVNAYWIPKGYDDQGIFNKKEYRNGICYYGQLYPARKAMLHYLRKKGIRYTKFQCSYPQLNDALNRFRICIVCNMVDIPKAGFINRAINWFSPSSKIDIYPGPELMIKNFEVAASGCVLFGDEIPELQDLGFRDGETIVTYKTFGELVEKINYYSNSPDKLASIAENAVALCKERHTWKHRMKMFEKLFSDTSF